MKYHTKTMRYIFSIFLIFAIFGLSLSDELRQKKIQLMAKIIRNTRALEKIRKRMLQETRPTSAPEPYSNSTEPEDETKADEPPKEVNPDSPVSKKGTNVGNPYSAVQILKFHDVKTTKNVILFGVYFFFYRKPIARRVIFRLRVTSKSRRIRNLDDQETAESIPSECSLVDPSLEGQQSEDGKKVDYDCTAQTEKVDATKADIALNTDVDMALVDKNNKTETVDFNNVNFRGNSSEEAENLQTVETNKEVELNDVELLSNDKNSFKIKGIASPANALSEDDEVFNFKIPSYDGNNSKTIDVICDIVSTDTSSGETTLECSGGDVNATTADLHLASGSNNKNTLNLNVKNWNEPNPTEIKTGKYYDGGSPSNNIVYRKNSSGLSGGAIAGIVVACVVVLVAASIAAIMLRGSKPTPPIDNTTVVGLRTVENI